MTIRASLLLLLFLLFSGSSCVDSPIDDTQALVSHEQDTTSSDPGDDDDSNDGRGGDSAADRMDRIAVGVCELAMRCCDPGSLNIYFGFWTANPQLAHLVSDLPPSDLEACRQKASVLMTEIPLGDWLEAVADGSVSFNKKAFGSCLDALQAASCGTEARTALFDSTCFGQAPPFGGKHQRAFVERTQTEGPCKPINDGIGSSFYGTCDPALAFCCYENDECGFPYGENQVANSGVCLAASGVGEVCSPGPPVQLCETGLNCDPISGHCIAPADDQLALGQECIDDGWNLLGDCVQSFCDVLGTGLCEAMKAEGETCFGAEECVSGACDGTCTPNELCSGT
jgi:hypothetical protein